MKAGVRNLAKGAYGLSPSTCRLAPTSTAVDRWRHYRARISITGSNASITAPAGILDVHAC